MAGMRSKRAARAVGEGRLQGRFRAGCRCGWETSSTIYTRTTLANDDAETQRAVLGTDEIDVLMLFSGGSTSDAITGNEAILGGAGADVIDTGSKDTSFGRQRIHLGRCGQRCRDQAPDGAGTRLRRWLRYRLRGDLDAPRRERDAVYGLRGNPADELIGAAIAVTCATGASTKHVSVRSPRQRLQRMPPRTQFASARRRRRAWCARTAAAELGEWTVDGIWLPAWSTMRIRPGHPVRPVVADFDDYLSSLIRTSFRAARGAMVARRRSQRARAAPSRIRDHVVRWRRGPHHVQAAVPAAPRFTDGYVDAILRVDAGLRAERSRRDLQRPARAVDALGLHRGGVCPRTKAGTRPGAPGRFRARGRRRAARRLRVGQRRGVPVRMRPVIRSLRSLRSGWRRTRGAEDRARRGRRPRRGGAARDARSHGDGCDAGGARPPCRNGPRAGRARMRVVARWRASTASIRWPPSR